MPEQLTADELHRMHEWCKDQAIHPLDIQSPEEVEQVRDILRDMGIAYFDFVPLDKVDLRGEWFLLALNGVWYAAPTKDGHICMERLS